MASNKLAAICRRVLRWYDKTHRDLPWRRTDDPYAIWIAETMLQQTQVATVVRHYERFLRAFPTVQALDRAPLRKVLALWSGLGYYRRAENLKKSAREIVSSYGGRVPQEYHSLLSLPGVGHYTAEIVNRHRHATFRAAVVEAYLAERCVCGFSLRLADRLIGVDAAHICR
jgi:A/G-specific adenine glycosylase